jgi:hypothetical protein
MLYSLLEDFLEIFGITPLSRRPRSTSPSKLLPFRPRMVLARVPSRSRHADRARPIR